MALPTTFFTRHCCVLHTATLCYKASPWITDCYSALQSPILHHEVILVLHCTPTLHYTLFLCTTQHSSASALSPCQTVFTCYKAPLYYTVTTLDPALQKTNVYTLAMIHSCGKELARVTFTHCMHLMQENQLLQVSA